MKSSVTIFKHVLAASLFLGCTSQVFAQSVVFSTDFNQSASQWSDNFVESGQASGVNYVWSGSGGVGNSGAVNVSGSPEAAYYKNGVAGFVSQTEGYTVSTFFRLKSTDTGASANMGFATGFIASTSDQLGVNSGTNTYLTLQAQILNTTAGNQTQYQLSFRSRSGSDAQLVNTAQDVFTVTNGNWYQFVTSYYYDSTLQLFTGVAQLWDYGVAGDLANPMLVTSFSSAALANSSFAVGESMYAAIRTGSPASGGSTRIDNFELVAIPEPSSAVALLVLGIGAIGARRFCKRVKAAA